MYNYGETHKSVTIKRGEGGGGNGAGMSGPKVKREYFIVLLLKEGRF